MFIQVTLFKDPKLRFNIVIFTAHNKMLESLIRSDYKNPQKSTLLTFGCNDFRLHNIRMGNIFCTICRIQRNKNILCTYYLKYLCHLITCNNTLTLIGWCTSADLAYPSQANIQCNNNINKTPSI